MGLKFHSKLSKNTYKGHTFYLLKTVVIIDLIAYKITKDAYIAAYNKALYILMTSSHARSNTCARGVTEYTS